MAEEILFRDGDMPPVAQDAPTPEVELSFSSELPVQRVGADGKPYLEILSHNPEDVDLTRLNSRHPLLLNHDSEDPENQVGVIVSARIDPDRKGRAIVAFSKGEKGAEIWQDVKDGIRSLVSVGYRLGREISRTVLNGLEARTFQWMPYEISLVSIPADPTVGVGRSAELKTADRPAPSEPLEEKATAMENTQTPSVDSIREQANRDQLARINEINAIAGRLDGKVNNVRSLADKAIAEGASVDQFRSLALNNLPSATPVAEAPKLDIAAKDLKRYSMARAIALQAEGRLDGLERELSDELSIKHGRKAEGFWMPDQVMARNAVAGTGTLGGMIVQTDNLASDFIEILRNKSQVMALGAKVLNLSRQCTIPRQAGAHTANWATETTASTLSGINLQQITLTPKAITSYVQYSKMLLQEADPSIDALLRNDIVEQLALAIDLAALHGGGSAEPTGIIGTSGIGSVLLATNGLGLNNTTAYPAMVSLENLVAAANADSGALAYLMRPAVRGQLKVTTRFASTNTPVYENDMVNGYKAAVSNQVKNNLTEGTATTITSPVFFGNWNDVIIANFGSTDVVTDPYSAGANRVIRIYAHRYADIGVRHPASFAVLGGVLNG